MLLGDIVSLTSGTYLQTLFGALNHLMTCLYVCSITPDPYRVSHYKENDGNCFLLWEEEARYVKPQTNIMLESLQRGSNVNDER